MIQTIEKRRSYLYVPGKKGISPDLLSGPDGNYPVVSESGRTFQLTKSPTILSLFDPLVNSRENRYEGILKAEVRENGLHFAIFPSETFWLFFSRRIHDLNPSGFFDLAINHFESVGTPYSYLMGEWVRGLGVNYDQYFKKLSETGDKVLAASSTWTGRQAKRNGFWIKDVSDVRDIDPNPFYKSVQVYFSKPTKI